MFQCFTNYPFLINANGGILSNSLLFIGINTLVINTKIHIIHNTNKYHSFPSNTVFDCCFMCRTQCGLKTETCPQDKNGGLRITKTLNPAKNKTLTSEHNGLNEKECRSPMLSFLLPCDDEGDILMGVSRSSNSGQWVSVPLRGQISLNIVKQQIDLPHGLVWTFTLHLQKNI